MTKAQKKYIRAHSKDQGIGIILTILLGPIGLLYASTAAGVVMTLIALATFPTVVGPVACWGLSVILGIDAISSHNRRVKAAVELGGGV